MKTLFCLSLVFSAALLATAQTAKPAPTERMALWPGKAPNGDGTFEDCSKQAQDRQAHGLPEQWVERAARLAENMHVVVMIDSLDVLSIARENSVLAYFLAQVDRLLQVPNVTVVTACRYFDRQYDYRIAQRTWEKEFTCRPLDWDTEIAPLLAKLQR